jgi:hypothetical protein
VALLCAGCGGGGHKQPPQPRLPHALAATWSREAAAVAAALTAGDPCGAERQATRLRTQVISAVNARRVPAALLEPLTSAVNSLTGRITCTPPAPAPAPQPKPAEPPKPPHGHGHDHGHGHGHDDGEGD